ncbi:MAG: MBL fold metallo-hydrolase [Cyanobacteria bacterium P01_A01_bin.40]
MNLTYFDSNSWLIEIENQRILLDPWLVGKLTFGNLPWLFEGKKNNPQPIPENIDLILLSQGLEDHAHPPTLKQLDKDIPVVASPNGAKVVQELGYKTVTALDHHSTFELGQVAIKAVPGSPIGPTLVENGYIISGLESGQNIYYEPHGYHSESLKKEGKIDVIITPLINLKLPLLGAVIKGQETALQVCQWLNPQVILSTAAGGDIDFKGLVVSILKAEGTVEEFNHLLQQRQLTTKAIDPQSGEKIELSLV